MLANRIAFQLIDSPLTRQRYAALQRRFDALRHFDPVADVTALRKVAAGLWGTG